jgi:hypothetical protein
VLTTSAESHELATHERMRLVADLTCLGKRGFEILGALKKRGTAIPGSTRAPNVGSSRGMFATLWAQLSFQVRD